MSSMSVVYGKFLYESIRVIQEIISPNLKLQHLQEILFSKFAYDVPNERGLLKSFLIIS